MNCRLCNKPIVLVPSAAERAAKNQHIGGRPAAFYIALFTEHSECTLAKRAADTSALMKRYRAGELQ